MTTNRLLIAASAAVPEWFFLSQLELLNVNDEGLAISFIAGPDWLSLAILRRWPSALEIARPSRSVLKRLMRDVDHVFFAWDGQDLSQLLFESRLAKIPIKLLPFEVTRVVNKKMTDEFDVYIGRGTPWGNPFAIGFGDGPDREDVLREYTEYFAEKLVSDSVFRKGILGLKGQRLACHCKPLACHGDVIAAYLNGPNGAYET